MSDKRLKPSIGLANGLALAVAFWAVIGVLWLI
jgi:hypothetical protein